MERLSSADTGTGYQEIQDDPYVDPVFPWKLRKSRDGSYDGKYYADSYPDRDRIPARTKHIIKGVAAGAVKG